MFLEVLGGGGPKLKSNTILLATRINNTLLPHISGKYVSILELYEVYTHIPQWFPSGSGRVLALKMDLSLLSYGVHFGVPVFPWRSPSPLI